jgi:predicted amidohydrolase YtcJ
VRSIRLSNAVIWDGGREIYGSIEIEHGRIRSVGDTAGGVSKEIDLGGRFVCPGFIDSHVHFLQGGQRLRGLQLRDASTPEEFIRRIEEFARSQPAGRWITGGDWDHELWGGELPQREWIDRQSGSNPMFITRLDGHMALANSQALMLAGIGRSTQDVAGGEIVRNREGIPTGIFKDRAMALVQRVIPGRTAEQDDEALKEAMAYVAARGITSVHDMSFGNWDELPVYRRAAERGDLRTRIHAAMPLQDWQRLREEIDQRGSGNEWLRIGGVKGFVDGSLGSRTAAMSEPYSDSPGESGLMLDEPEQMYEWLAGADSAGLQLMVHAIGDRAVTSLLDWFERLEQENGPRDRRWRMEHAQHILPADLPRFSRLGVIASMQPSHLIDDGCRIERMLGRERAKGSFPFRSLLDHGVRIAFGSDWFVAAPSPLEGIYAAVTRRTADGNNPEGWIPAEKITIDEALTAFTQQGAYASFDETMKGRIAPGFAADLVVLDSDPRRAHPEEIARIGVSLTLCGGEAVHDPNGWFASRMGNGAFIGQPKV